MSPAFSRPRLRTYLDDMIRITEDCVGRWTVGEPLEVAAAMEEITRRIATKTLFGEDAGAAEAADSRSSAASGPAASNRGVEPPAGTGSLIQHALRELANPWTKLLPFDLPGMPYHRFLNASNRLQTAIREIVRRKQERMRDEGDVLSVLIRARDEESGLQLTDEQLLGHVGVLFAAGHETSANALNWTLLLLSQHPRICGDVVDELRSVLRGGVPTAEQLEKLPLLESVIKESMRVLPPVPWNGRVMSRADCLLDHDLPAGTEVFLSIYQTHHSPELFARPRRFDPRRWEGPEPSPFAYMPFSVGPRKCIGAAFAMVEMKIVLAAVLQRYRLEYLPLREINRLGHIVMTPKFGLPMRVHRQDGRFEQGVGGVRGNVREMVELPGD